MLQVLAWIRVCPGGLLLTHTWEQRYHGITDILPACGVLAPFRNHELLLYTIYQYEYSYGTSELLDTNVRSTTTTQRRSLVKATIDAARYHMRAPPTWARTLPPARYIHKRARPCNSKYVIILVLPLRLSADTQQQNTANTHDLWMDKAPTTLANINIGGLAWRTHRHVFLLGDDTCYFTQVQQNITCRQQPRWPSSPATWQHRARAGRSQSVPLVLPQRLERAVLPRAWTLRARRLQTRLLHP